MFYPRQVTDVIRKLGNDCFLAVSMQLQIVTLLQKVEDVIYKGKQRGFYDFRSGFSTRVFRACSSRMRSWLVGNM